MMWQTSGLAVLRTMQALPSSLRLSSLCLFCSEKRFLEAGPVLSRIGSPASVLSFLCPRLKTNAHSTLNRAGIRYV
ncbi:uncharacterized protein B0T15DRAFT_29620 [Chaetomium strumarium]|uniref:Uncharacterized protein n=1 Tax=Chaetomium strumarium TaxID=1170767 RepID=A0AAJ0H1P9_9PEZI|nr:hypothetical protein B0T15DRAFT_29620 [Chaetomium strumarium]